LEDAGVVTMAGAAAGLILLWMAGRAIDGFLFHVGGHDPLTLVAATAVIVIAAGAAAAAQAGRAARVNPVQALSQEGE
jgi:ABC-type antimicrobial peptide transport system permease subunit